MNDSQSSSSPGSLANRVGLGVIALFVALTLGSAFLSAVFWILGVGVPQRTHNLMGLLFVAINVVCVVGGTRCLKRGRRLAAIAVALSAVPLCVAAVAVAVYGFHL